MDKENEYNQIVKYNESMKDEAWLRERYDEICSLHESGFCLISVKIKRLMVYNRLFGRKAGDELVESVYKAITAFMNELGNIAHIHAGYYNILLKLPMDYDELFKYIISLNDALEQLPDPYDAGRVYLGMGIYRIQDFTIDFDTAQYNADICRVESREASFRNTHFEIYGQTYHDHNLIDFRLEHTFKTALDQGHICFYLQPKVDLKTGEIYEAEALARWIDPVRGMIPVGEFLPGLEKNGLIDELDLFIFENVCELINRFIKQYDKKIKVSVNLSSCFFNYRYFFAEYREIHERIQCPKECIEIELLESIILNQVERVRDVVKEIQDYGFSCALDDFGSGYSSFSVLTNVQLETLKIDRSLFMGEHREKEKVILRHIIETAKELNVKVVAEGVEQPSYLSYLDELGCDYVQGYVFYKPMPVEEFEERFIKGNEKAELPWKKYSKYSINGGNLLETIELKFQYTQSEFVRAERQYLISSKIIHKYDLALVAVFLLFSVFNMLFSSFSLFSILIFGLVIVVTTIGSYLYILMPILKFNQIAKYREEYTLVFSKEAIHFKTPSIESELKWNIYSALWDSRDFYFLIQAPRIYTIIPKRVFKDQNEKQIFEDIVQSRVKTTKHV